MKKESEKKKTILVVEDERALLNVVNKKLEKNGFNVITARSVDEVFSAQSTVEDLSDLSIRNIYKALDYLDNLRDVDAIWLDHNLLGKESGIDLAVKLRANGKHWQEIPIFIISNTENPETIQSYLDLGKSKYYVKSNHRLDEIISDIDLFLDDVNKNPSGE